MLFARALGIVAAMAFGLAGCGTTAVVSDQEEDKVIVQGYAITLPSFITVDTYNKPILTMTLPAGKYILAASIDVSGAGVSTGYMGGIGVADCTLGGYETASVYLLPNDTYISEQKSLSLNVGITHPGGPVTLTCSRNWNSIRVDAASMTAVKVDALG
jgi:hypothetical protein